MSYLRKVELKLIIFYSFYFGWLSAIIALSQDSRFLNYFVVGIAVFYFILLRQADDIIWFVIGAFIPIFMAILLSMNDLRLDFQDIETMQIWFPVAWGTTIVTLRRLYFTITKDIMMF